MDLPHKQELFAREYSGLFDAVYRYVFYRLRHRESTQDLVSEIFTKAYARLADFNADKGTLKQWLLGIAKNELLMHWRRQKPFLPLEDQIPDNTHDKVPLDHSLDQHILVEKIYQQLPPSNQLLLTLRYIDDLSYQELAEITGRDPAALRQFFSRLHRALRLEFQDEYNA